MLKFKSFLLEGATSFGNDEKGKLHEILVGHHLNGGKHMPKHVGKTGESAEETHARLKALAIKHGGQKLYDKADARAKSAAKDIERQVTADGHKIKHVHWTSKAGDLHASTGIHASQKEDPSDIVVTTHKGGKVKHHGVSLKVSDKTSNVPASSLGQAFSGRKTRNLGQSHKSSITDRHPELKGKNAKARKDWAKENPQHHEQIKKDNRTLLAKVAKQHARELNAHLRVGNHKKVVDHIRQVLHAHPTPMQGQGHSHIKHTTWTSAKGHQHKTANPAKDHEHILNDPKNITVKHSGGSVHFYHKGKKFATQAHKFDSQSDPLSTLKTAGRSA
jgi:hypothetical protein